MKAFFNYVSLILPILFLVLSIIVRRQVRKKSRLLSREKKLKKGNELIQ
jgi:hypothetical protein